MDIGEFKRIFEKYFNEIIISEKQYKDFYFYMNSILKWNENINITSITDKEEFIVKHFVDSLSINKYITNKASVIDIGTGAGFPGIPLKIINEDKMFTLIDSVGKKLKVIEEINKNLNLKKLEIIHTRAEELAHNNRYRECYDAAVTRAVSNMTTICEYMIPFIKVGGIAICMKGPQYEEEYKNSIKAIEILGGKLERIDKIKIAENNERNIIVIKKVSNTPLKYPRSQGKPLKEPIK